MVDDADPGETERFKAPEQEGEVGRFGGPEQEGEVGRFGGPEQEGEVGRFGGPELEVRGSWWTRVIRFFTGRGGR